MAIRAARKGGRAWSDALFGRPWLLVAAVALLVALPVLVLGQVSENDTRARLAAAQVDSAAHAAEAVSTDFNNRTALIGQTLEALAEVPRPDTSAIALAVQHGDVATLQALADLVQRLYARSLLRVYIAALAGAQSHSSPVSAEGATIVAVSPRGTGLVGLPLSDPTVRFGTIPQLRTIGTCLGFSDAYPGTIDAPSRVVLTVPSTSFGCDTFFETAVIGGRGRCRPDVRRIRRAVLGRRRRCLSPERARTAHRSSARPDGVPAPRPERRPLRSASRR